MSVVMLNVILLSVIMQKGQYTQSAIIVSVIRLSFQYIACNKAEHCYAECHYAECHYA